MKKLISIIFIIISLIISPKVEATHYYSEYGPYGDYTNTPTFDSDINTCEVERRYRWYQETVEGNYYIFNQNDSKHPNVDLNKHYQTEYTGWQNDKPASLEHRQIYTRYAYEVTEMKKIRYIHFTNVHGNYNYFRITELQILNNNQPIDYSYYCEGCNNNFNNYIKNNIVTENMSYLNNEGYLRIDLQDLYDASNITIKISLYDWGDIPMTYTIKYTSEESLNSQVYFENAFSEVVAYTDLSNIEVHEKNINDLKPINPEWNIPAIYLSPQEATPTRLVNIYQQYQYRDTYFYYYNTIKNYVPGYFLNYSEGYLKDSNAYEDYYRCRTRDKVSLPDEIIIKDYNQTLDSFISENTTSDYQIIGNINYYQNGVYPVTYVFPFITIDRQVTVSIANNDINLLLEKISNLKQELEMVHNQLYEQIVVNENNTILINDLMFDNDYLTVQINDLNSLLLTAQQQIDQLLNENSLNQEMINELLNTKNNLEDQIRVSTSELNRVKKDLNNLITTNNNYLETINNLTIEKDQLVKQIEALFINIEKIEENAFYNDQESKKEIQELLTTKNELKTIITNLNKELNETNKTNQDNALIIENLNKHISTLETKINDNIYQEKIVTLNNTIIKQNQNIKEIVTLKKEAATKYENEILKLNLLLKQKQEELTKLQNGSKENVNLNTDVYKSSFSFDIINLVIFLLIIIFIILLRITIKKNVELK